MRPRILIVDDLQEILVTMRRYFAAHGFDVDCASEKEEAEALIGVHNYAVVVTDLQLTPLRSNEGLELVRVLHHECPNTKVIMLTAYNTEEVEKEAGKYGVASFLKKPVPLPVLHDAVRESLGR